ncbi:MAG: DUF3551 domain-containing protein [Rhodopseudomonas sp.]|uniref:DUF3551 domain-containing protein n=1 Tax=unclassified Rhodopseudomonas TaxID=2638247 RepID=UPI0013E00B5B|nr:DUF3551 domain-containing protein [Rhodopseudomonas sp. BR0M22]MCD0421327.1 DUF3551 domain-containing protein [Rubrivivax sp. JA1024]NEW90581.1 DUF3551 domain-containing protein [Rhodopseudomonas sp. BR0M22]
MTKTGAAVFAAATILTLAAAPASARDFPYCLQGGEWGYPGNCQFDSYQQCMVTASGTRAYCDINPVVAFSARQQLSEPQDVPPPTRKLRHRRH